MNVDHTQSNHCHRSPPQGKITIAYHPLNHRLAIETAKWSIIPIQGDESYAILTLYNVVENETHFVMKCPLTTL